MTVSTAGLTAAEPVAEPVAETRREPRLRWGLRRRITLIFTVGALMLSLFLAFVTYGFARSSVVQQRENAAFDAAKNITPTPEAWMVLSTNDQLEKIKTLLATAGGA